MHGELFTGRTVRLAVKLSQGCRASEQWLVMDCEDSIRMWLIIESLTWVGQKMTCWRTIQHHCSRLTASHGMWNPRKEDSQCLKLRRAAWSTFRHGIPGSTCSRADQISSPPPPNAFKIFRYGLRVTSGHYFWEAHTSQRSLSLFFSFWTSAGTTWFNLL